MASSKSNWIGTNPKWFWNNNQMGKCYERPVTVMSGEHRNQACICGSGKKWKKCCG